MKQVLAIALLVLAGSLGSAQAAVITFEDLPPDDAVLPPLTDRISGGFLFDSPADHLHIDDGTGWGANNGTNIMVIDAFGSDLDVTFSPVGGGTFALTGLDLSKANTFSTTSATDVEVTGNLAGGSTVFASFALAPNFTFQTFGFDSSWTNLTSVVLNGVGSTCCGDVPANYFGLDNVVVESTVVPEPAALTLFGLGSAYLIARRRRHHR
jgi:hypothetical protein